MQAVRQALVGAKELAEYALYAVQENDPLVQFFFGPVYLARKHFLISMFSGVPLPLG